VKTRTLRSFGITIGVVLLMAGISAASASASPPAVKTSSAISVQAQEATLHGFINTEGRAAIYGYEYGTTTAYGNETGITEVPAGSTGWLEANTVVKGLKPQTTYHFRLIGVNDDGVALGEDRTFTTLPPPTFQADQYPAWLTFEQASFAPLVLTIEGGLKMTCNSITGVGALSEAQSTLTVTPSLSECVAFGLSAKVKANGCSYITHAGETYNGPSVMDITCPSGSSLQIQAGTCEVTIPAQAALSTVTSNNFSGDVYSEFNLSGVKYNKVKDGFLCPLGGTGEKEDGKYVGTASVSAINSSGAAIGVRVK
jgi:hypothetical protein